MLLLEKCSMNKSWGLKLIDDSFENFKKLKVLFNQNFFVKIHGFLQGDSSHYLSLWELDLQKKEDVNYSFLYIEFWTNKEADILEICLNAAKEMNMDLILS